MACKGIIAYMMKKYLTWIILLFCLGIAFIYWFTNSNYMKKRIYPLEYKEEISKYSKEHQLDPYLVMGIIWVESRFKPEATSHRDARGLMQIIPTTGQWIAEQIGFSPYDDAMLYDPETNVEFGCWYFDYLLGVFDDDVKLALAAYNGGMGNVRKWLKDSKYSDDGKELKDIPFKETKDYVGKVMDARSHYEALY